MSDIIIICFVIFIILTFFYKQSICEFRINQIEWSQKDNIQELLHEKIPLVIRTIPSAAFWTQTDVTNRSCYDSIPLFKEMTLSEWLVTKDIGCPWKYSQAELIAAASGISIWATKWMNPIIPFFRYWIFPKYYCWAGTVGLHKTFATWSCIFPVDGEIILTLMPESVENSLPTDWIGCIPSQLTIKDTPFVGDLKFIDIILRPGNCIFLPPHWFVAWQSNDTKKPMVCQISYHSPISYLAFSVSPHTK